MHLFNTSSRTGKSFVNMWVSLTYSMLSLFISFFSRGIFLDYLGTEVLGLNTTASNLLSFLNLAELGVGTAISFTLYKPMYERDYDRVNEIVALQGYIYRRVAMVLIAGSVLLGCAFPWIFSKMELPLWYAYASFGVMLFSSLLSYFFNYRQIVVGADQRQYRITFSYQTMIIIKSLVQMWGVSHFSNPFVWWVCVEAIFSYVGTMIISLVLRHYYPFLRKPLLTGKQLIAKFPDVVTKTKQLFIHRISEFVLKQTSPLIIYAFVSMTMVAFYGNYMTIVSGITMLATCAYSGLGAGIGSLIATGERKRILSVFHEIYSLHFIVGSLAGWSMWTLSAPFVTMWIGEQYVFGPVPLFLIILNMFIQLTRNGVELFKNGYGLFGDVGAPVVETILNLGCSLALGAVWGLNGVLLGVNISLILVVVCWKPYYLYRHGFKMSPWHYVALFGRHAFALALAVGACYLFDCSAIMSDSTELLPRFLKGGVEILLFAAVLITTLTIIVPGPKLIATRLLHLKQRQ